MIMSVGRVSNVELSGSFNSILDFELPDYDAMNPRPQSTEYHED